MTEGIAQTKKKRSSSLRRRSKSQIRNPTQSKSEREQHLQLLETRLDKAKQVRDNYLTYLKQKYPDWRQSTPNLMKSPPPYQSHVHLPGQIPDYSNLPEAFHFPAGSSISRVPRTSMMDELETSKYFWTRGPPEVGSRLTESYQTLRPTSDQIPSSSIYLETDMPGVLSKLEEIRSNLKDLREHRLTMPTVEYFKTYAPDFKFQFFQSSENPQPFSRSSYYGNPEKADLPSLAEIRARILNMDLNVEMRTREILDEAYKRQEKILQRREMKLDRDPTEGMPEWLKKDENIIEKMEKEEEKQLEEILKIKDPEKIEVTVPKESENEKSESIIAPTRTIVFNTGFVDKKESEKNISEVSKPTDQQKSNFENQQTSKTTNFQTSQSSNLSSQLSPPIVSKSESSYSKMLQLLKPSSKNIPSSSSSDDEFELKKSSTISVTKITEFNQEKEKPKIDFGKNLFGGGTNLGAKMQPLTGKDDSDDDFFN